MFNLDRVNTVVAHKLLRVCMSIYLFFIKILFFIRKNSSKNSVKCGYVILITGRFYSSNWILSHLLPLSRANKIKSVIVVSTYKIPHINNVEVIYPPEWLIRLIGSTSARLVIFFIIGLRRKPDIIGGFHLLLNGLAALFIARLVGAISLYNCGGGVREVVGGGYSTENRIFNKLKEPNYRIELQLLQAVSFFDLVIVRGTEARDYFSQCISRDKIHIVTGGINGERFYPTNTESVFDLIITGRISRVKRIDRFIQSVKCISVTKPDISAVIIGDGPLKKSLEKMSEDIGLTNNIKFAGHQDKVEKWLQQSRLFVLTSDSEGLSLALIEAMLCGLPAVVSDVGDLSDIVTHGVNGYLVSDYRPETFAKYYYKILEDTELTQKMSKNASKAARRCEIHNVSKLWDDFLQNL